MSNNNINAQLLMDKMKRVGRSMVDTGAKAILKADIVFLEREIKSRKQRFGVEVYDAMELLEVDNEMTIEEKETKIRISFDQARKDIAVLQAKIECKKEEVGLLEAQQAANAALNDMTNFSSNSIPPSSGNVLVTKHRSEMEYGNF